MDELHEMQPTILVIDDEKINLMVLTGMLHAAGYEALTASSGPVGRDVARSANPDLILLDIMMPEENGFETCRLLKNDPDTTDIPIIFISALSDVGNKVRGLEIGAVDYITKPFEKSEVIARIRLHLKLKYAHRAIIAEQAKRLKQITEAQQSILVSPEDYPEAHFAIRYLPVHEAGGDFYDVFPTGKNRFNYFIADISGHDLGASFVTSSLKALLRQNAEPLYTPVETMKNINSVLHSILKDGKYLTAQSLHINRNTWNASIINAGHPAPIYQPVLASARLLAADGDILGVFPSIVVEPTYFAVTSGDRFFLYTDGLTERFGRHKKQRQQGETELLTLCDEYRTMPIQDAVDRIVERVKMADTSLQDDVVLMAIEV